MWRKNNIKAYIPLVYIESVLGKIHNITVQTLSNPKNIIRIINLLHMLVSKPI